MTIEWTNITDFHASGTTQFGKVWIRIDRTGFATGVYTMFGTTKKYVPKPEETWTVEDAKAIAELALEDEIESRKRFPK